MSRDPTTPNTSQSTGLRMKNVCQVGSLLAHSPLELVDQVRFSLLRRSGSVLASFVPGLEKRLADRDRGHSELRAGRTPSAAILGSHSTDVYARGPWIAKPYAFSKPYTLNLLKLVNPNSTTDPVHR